ncbi:mRNA-capping enzyme subunit beta [Spathaspora sp. JA1]|nr:mRNA-capping enzyme subunit beta [Spathaspora sp. JA1]
MNFGSVLNKESSTSDRQESKIEQVEKSKEVGKANPEETTPPGNKSKTSVEEDITTINQNLSSIKIKRYDTPPIWAQRVQLEKFKSNAQNAKSSDQQVFDFSTTVDLQCSITGEIPPASASTNRKIAEWVYANFSNIEEHNRKYVELEVKFGKILDKKTGNRFNFNNSEYVFTHNSNIRYDMQVEKISWQEVRNFFEELERNYQEDHKADNQPGPKIKFIMIESDQTDSFYRIGGKGETKKIRVSKDNRTTHARYTAIHKERIADLYINNPSSMYDFRLSLSLEIPVPETIVERTIKNKPNYVRDKKRTTWTHAPTITQFDLTRVFKPLNFKNKYGKKIVTHDITHEIELEIDTLEVFNAINTQSTDNSRLEQLVEAFINNARVINNRVTKLALPKTQTQKAND